ncbi:MAG: hypothetical protein OXH11_17785 [Candidatus Aminicenantes bacterium]|nr:hypothetical protein [Candidatus Aminicenantes bacterium]
MSCVSQIPLLALLASFAGGPASDTLPRLEEVFSVSELRLYRAKNDYKSHMNLFRKALERNSKLLSAYGKKSDLRAVLKVLADMKALSEHALKETPAREKDGRSRETKRLEIRARRIVEAMEDLKLVMPFEYRDDFDDCIRSLEKLRKHLLGQLFGRVAPSGSFSAPAIAHGLLASKPVSRAFSLAQSADGFTDEEYTKIQRAQKLDRRTRVFLEIAEDRLEALDERWIRLTGKEPPVTEKKRKKKKRKSRKDEDEGPLAFHAHWELLHAYERAIDGIMINIDEKANQRRLSEKEIHKVLKRFCENVLKFEPRLETMEKLAVQLDDDDYWLTLEEARKTTGIARKGCRLGLGGDLE